MSAPLGFLRDNLRWLGAGLLLTFASSFGQTFFIALMGGQYRAELGLSHGQFGGLYMAATLLSALTLIQAGGIADRLSARRLGVLVMLGLVTACLVMSQVANAFMLFVAIYLLRFLGQGMLTHLEVTAIARWFAATRGKALAVASWGHPIGEGFLPAGVALMLTLMDWRSVWLVMAGVLALVILPVFALTLREERRPQGTETAPELLTGLRGRHWTRPEVLRHGLFWWLIPVLMGSPLIGTAVLFHQAHIAEIKGWTLAQLTAGFPVYAALSIGSSLVFGVLVDRFTACRILPLYLVPLGIGIVTLGLFDGPWVALVALGSIGMTAGAGMATVGAMWAELYGTRHLGSIRALSVAAMVFSSALGPGLTGILIDFGVGFESQCVVMGLYCLAMSPVIVWLMRREDALPDGVRP